eukprot:363632-Chlamydomonas_euryale.AAC.4
MCRTVSHVCFRRLIFSEDGWLHTNKTHSSNSLQLAQRLSALHNIAAQSPADGTRLQLCKCFENSLAATPSEHISVARQWRAMHARPEAVQKQLAKPTCRKAVLIKTQVTARIAGTH